MDRIKKFTKKYNRLCDDFGVELEPVVECRNRFLRWIIKLFGKKSGLVVSLIIKERNVE